VETVRTTSADGPPPEVSAKTAELRTSSARGVRRCPIFLFILVLLAACRVRVGGMPRPTPTELPKPVANPTFVNHPQPSLPENPALEFAVFQDAGCPENQYGFHRCGKDSLLRALGCEEIATPPEFAALLQPSYPLAQCMNSASGGSDSAEFDWVGVSGYTYSSDGPFFFRDGGLASVFVRYVVFVEGRFELIETEDEFRSIFAPIETPEEALGYAVTATGLWTSFGQTPTSFYVYYAGEIEDTHVDVVADGYLVHLFHIEVFGCGPHWTHAIDFVVTPDGHITQVRKEPVYRHPAQDGICVD
jgi:hypothetical protein